MYAKNEKAFDELTDDSAYWLGFLAADGSVALPTAKSGGMVRLSLKDREHVKAFVDFLSSDVPVQSILQKTNFGEFYIYTAVICSSRLARALTAKGITPNKTYTVVADVSVRENRHFWRGVVDGDGSIGRNKRGQLVLYLGCASEQLIRQFEHFVKLHIDTNATTNQHKGNKHWRFQLIGARAERLVELLYSNARYRLKA